MATPTSAALRAGASFTPVARHGHDLALLLPRLPTMRILSLRGDARA